jgi:hypothetical protein
MEESDQQGSDVRSLLEQSYWNNRVFGESRLTVDEREYHQSSHDNERNNLCRVPGENDASEI